MRLIKLSILHLFGKESRQNKLTILSVSDLISHARSFSDRVDRSEVPFPVPVVGGGGGGGWVGRRVRARGGGGGGFKFVGGAFHMSPTTIRKGLAELTAQDSN